MKMKRLLFILSFCLLFACNPSAQQETEMQSTLADVTNITPNPPPFLWENATIYFLLTDRFRNGNPDNDINFNRTEDSGKLRGFMGGDIRGIIQKIDEDYFTNLGISAIWFTPIVEQIHGAVDEGTGNTYGYHGYWAKDWTALDPNFGTKEDLAELVEKAHAKGIRILLDVVINHTGPVTDNDPLWQDWVRTNPQCTYEGYESTVSCALVENLPDIKTESNQAVDLPRYLKDKWQEEGRLNDELAELDAFFKRTRYPRAPRFYIIKWLTDYIEEFGIDGYRVDTVKHTEESVWGELWKEAQIAFAAWKQQNPAKVVDEQPFYMVGEVYGYGISSGELYDFGDQKVNYFEQGFKSLINFEFKYDAEKYDYEGIFVKYDTLLSQKLAEQSVLNYLASHDDGSPFDANRTRSIEAANKLLLSPGAAQVYYGDESNRSLVIEGTEGDATLRSFMNWERIEDVEATEVQTTLSHWQKLGQFRNAHPAIGAGQHQMITQSPYTFKRIYQEGDYIDKIIVGLDMPSGHKTIEVSGVFAEGVEVKDTYSGTTAKVTEGKVVLDTNFEVVLLEQIL